MTIDNLTVEVENLLIGGEAEADHRSSVSVSFEIPQEEGPAAQFALDAVIGVLGETIPSLNATARFTGFQLDTREGDQTDVAFLTDHIVGPHQRQLQRIGGVVDRLLELHIDQVRSQHLAIQTHLQHPVLQPPLTQVGTGHVQYAGALRHQDNGSYRKLRASE